MAKNTRKVVILTALVSISMFGFCFALVPLYKTYCKVTGINTALTVAEFAASADLQRTITVEWLTTNNANLPWEFYPLKTKIKVHPGELHKVFFFVKNKSNATMTVRAVPSYVPANAAVFFHKIECFCFRQQTLQPNDEKYMPVVFRIDRQLPPDIQTISLAYTLFDVTPKPSSRISL